MSKYLFLFTVGPVQSFIAQARKTQDLYAGSQILTELVKAGIEEVGRENIIFPYAYPDEDNKWQDVKSLPNRFLAVVEKEAYAPLLHKFSRNIRSFGEADGCKALLKTKPYELADKSKILMRDADGDGIPDDKEKRGDSNGNGIPNYLDVSN